MFIKLAKYQNPLLQTFIINHVLIFHLITLFLLVLFKDVIKDSFKQINLII